MTDQTFPTIDLHGGPADGARYGVAPSVPLAREVVITLRLKESWKITRPTPWLAQLGEAHAVYRYVQRGDSSDYDWAEATP